MKHVRPFPLNPRTLIAIMSLGLMLGLPMVLSHEVHSKQSEDSKQQQVTEALEGAPYRIENWEGVDVPVPTAAIEMLRPSAILSRNFTNVEDGRAASLVVIHCTDARDMDGHFPPVCYPSRGWIHDRNVDEQFSLVVGEKQIPVTLYHFRGGVDLGLPGRLHVFNFFLQANGVLTPDRPVVNHLLERHSRSARGIVQVQVVMSGQFAMEDATAAASTLLQGAMPLLKTLAEGPIR